VRPLPVILEIGITTARIPIAGVAGDQQAALFAKLVFSLHGEEYHGTGSYVMNTGRKFSSPKRADHDIAWAWA